MNGTLIGLGDDVSVERRLVETIRWCSTRASVASKPMFPARPWPASWGDGSARLDLGLRSDDLRPAHDGDEVVVNRESVCSVVRRRAALLAGAGLPHSSDVVRRGRLLIYVPEQNLADGASGAASLGFFDVCDAPPWDTWIAMFREGDWRMGPEYLVSWVPEAVVQRVNEGIDVNVVGCIAWLSEMSTPTTVRLRAAGLLS